MNYKGVIIEESLTDTSVLGEVKIFETKVEPITEEHGTPHLKQWTLHEVEVEESQVDEIAYKILPVLDTEHGHWYADFHNEQYHYIIYSDKIFKIDRAKPEQYEEATAHGIALGIPEYQVDFSPHVEQWERNNQ